MKNNSRIIGFNNK